MSDYEEITDFILNAGINVNLQDKDGDTFIMSVACDDWNETLVEKIVNDYGADIHIKNKDGKTALDKAVEYKNTKMEEFLRSKGAK